MTQTKENPETMASLYGAIAKAQADCKGVEKSSENSHHRYKYASAEAVIEAATEALAPHGLALICTHITPSDDRQTLTVGYMLTHESGAAMLLGPYSLTVHPGQGRPMDKAITTAATYLQSYALRGILNIPRVEEGAERDSLDDQKIAQYRKHEAETRHKVGQGYRSLWTSSQAFFEDAKIERTRDKKGGDLFKRWIAFMAHPDKPYPDATEDQLVSISLAKKALADWKKSEDEDRAQVVAEFAGAANSTAGEDIQF